MARFVAEQKVSEDELAAAQQALAGAAAPSDADALEAVRQALADAEVDAQAAAGALATALANQAALAKLVAAD